MGLAAIAAATWVGSNQVRISRTQIDLGLFGERYSVYREVAAWLGYIVANASDAPPELQSRFLQAKDKATFLFPPAVDERLSDLWRQAASLHADRQVERASRQDGAVPLALVERIAARHDELARRHANLSSEFGERLAARLRNF